MNELIHLLTNRDDGFASRFIKDDGYQVRESRHPVFLAANGLRDILGLGIRGTDWYWKPLHAAILADKGLSKDFNTLTTQSPHTNLMKSPVFTNCRVIGRKGPPVVAWKPGTLPKSFTWSFVYDGYAALDYTNGNDTGEITCVEDSGKVLLPDLSGIMPGVDFGVIPAQGLVGGATFGWTIEPSSYPLKHVLSVVEASPYFTRLSMEYMVQDIYSGIICPVFRLGQIAALIAKATRDNG